ncbi:MAG: hypothetical protein LLG09_01355 [Negativicutes bacterium]|nr:hypothetical protein [Negativicutes bacterium]
MQFSQVTSCYPQDLSFVLDQLQVCSPYGRRALQNMAFYLPGEEKEQQLALDNVEILMQAQENYPIFFVKLRDFYHSVQEIEGILTALSRNEVLDEIALFQLKVFLLQYQDLQSQGAALLNRLGLHQIQLPSLAAALLWLDPQQYGLRAFYLDEQSYPALACVRQQKLLCEQRLRLASAAEQAGLLAERSKWVAAEAAEEMLAKRAITEHLTPYTTELQQAIRSLGRLELDLAKASLAIGEHLTRPALAPEPFVILQEMIHPGVAAILQNWQRRFTPVSIRLQPGATVITGANMGGKSVLLRSLMLNLTLWQMGFFIYAKAAVLPLFSHLAYLGEDQQSVELGLSSFGAEISRLNHFIQDHQGQFTFLALDEFVRGTNPKEGALLLQAITAYFNRQSGMTVLTTHYDGVASFANAHYQVTGLQKLDAAQFSQAIQSGEDPVFYLNRSMDYTLLPVDREEAIPQEARRICRLLGLEAGILDQLEK